MKIRNENVLDFENYFYLVNVTGLPFLIVTLFVVGFIVGMSTSGNAVSGNAWNPAAEESFDDDVLVVVDDLLICHFSSFSTMASVIEVVGIFEEAVAFFGCFFFFLDPLLFTLLHKTWTNSAKITNKMLTVKELLWMNQFTFVID